MLQSPLITLVSLHWTHWTSYTLAKTEHKGFFSLQENAVDSCVTCPLGPLLLLLFLLLLLPYLSPSSPKLHGGIPCLVRTFLFLWLNFHMLLSMHFSNLWRPCCINRPALQSITCSSPTCHHLQIHWEYTAPILKTKLGEIFFSNAAIKRS